MHRPLQRARRALLAALPAALLGCRRAEAGFHSLDVSGADWGRDFRLHDAAGRVRTLADYRGRVVLLFFGFTQCPDICPTALSRAAAVMALLGEENARLQVLFVTIDPERDVPQMLAAYTAAFHPGFVGLYGSLEETAAAAGEFKIFYQKVPTGSSYTMDHSAVSYLFDPAGRLRLAVRHGDSAQDLADDVSRLLRG